MPYNFAHELRRRIEYLQPDELPKFKEDVNAAVKDQKKFLAQQQKNHEINEQKRIAERDAAFPPATTYYRQNGFDRATGKALDFAPVTDARPVVIKGAPEGLEFFAHKTDGKAWAVTESSTGARAGNGNTKTAAIADATTRAEKIGPDKYLKIVQDARKKHGTTPRFDAVSGAKPKPDFRADNTGAVNLATYAGLGPLAKRVYQKYFTSRGNLPEPAFALKNRMEGERAGLLNESNRISVDFTRAMRKAGMDKPTPQQRAMLNDVLDGNAPDPSLPKPVVDAVVAMRDNIDRLSQRMLDENLVDPKLKATIAANKGEYVRRTYAIDRDPNWIENIDPKVRADYKAYLRTTMPSATDAQLDHHINAMLEERRTGGGMEGFGKGGTWASKDLSLFKRRGDVHPTLRALYGEDVDPKVRHVQSIKSMSDFIAKQRFLDDVKTVGKDVFFFDEGNPNIDPRASIKIAADKNASLAPLNGLYTYPEVAEALTKTFEPKSNYKIFEQYMKLNATAKYSKVVLSLKAQIRQIVGNNMFLVANGHNPLQGETLRGVRMAWQHMRNTGSPETQAYMNKAVRLGILDDSATAGEFSAVLRDAKWRDSNLMKVPEAMYRFGDNWQRLTLWELEKQQYRKAYPEWSEAQIEQHAAEIVNNQSPTYSRASQAVRDFRRFPVLGPFATFSAEILRTSKNIVQQTYRELRSDNAQVRKIGGKRFAGMVFAGGLSYTAGELSKWALSVTRQDDADLRKFAAPWMKNGNWVYTDIGADGKAWIIDTSYTDPYAYGKKPAVAALSGDGIAERAMGAVEELLAPFTQEQLLTSAIADIARNKRGDNGREIWKETDTAAQQSQKIAARLGEAFTPGAATDIEKIIRGFQGKGTESGRPINPWTELIGMATGFRVQEIDPMYSLQFKAREYMQGMSDAASNFSSAARRPDTQNPEDLKAARADTEAKRKIVFDDMVEMTQAAQRLGISKAKIIQALRKGGVSGEGVRRLLANKIGAYRPPDDLMADPNVREAMR